MSLSIASIVVSALLVGTVLLSLLSLKWDFRFAVAARLIAASAVVSVLLLLVLSQSVTSSILLVGLGVALQCVAYMGILAFLFYRDPERTPPGDGRSIISPADGEVIYIRKLAPGALLKSEKQNSTLVLDELQESELGSKELWQVGISMKFTDVHVNRAPIAGKVSLVLHRPGRFLSLRRADALNQNERQTMVITGQGTVIGIVQIASRLVRRIESYVERLEQVELGQRIGMIKFGSQVDLFVPTESVAGLTVKEGDLLVAGRTVIAHFESVRSGSTATSVAR
jgi:phosphatidylserine decarboxylase